MKYELKNKGGLVWVIIESNSGKEIAYSLYQSEIEKIIKMLNNQLSQETVK